MNRNPLFFFLFFLSVASAFDVTTLQNFPLQMIAGSEYSAQFNFTSNYASTYYIYVNVTNIAYDEISLYSQSRCTEITGGRFACVNSMAEGTNYANVSVRLPANLAPADYHFSTVFSVTQLEQIPVTPVPAIIPQNFNGGGSSFSYIPQTPTPSPVQSPAPPPTSSSTPQASVTPTPQTPVLASPTPFQSPTPSQNLSLSGTPAPTPRATPQPGGQPAPGFNWALFLVSSLASLGAGLTLVELFIVSKRRKKKK